MNYSKLFLAKQSYRATNVRKWLLNDASSDHLSVPVVSKTENGFDGCRTFRTTKLFPHTAFTQVKIPLQVCTLVMREAGAIIGKNFTSPLLCEFY